MSPPPRCRHPPAAREQVSESGKARRLAGRPQGSGQILELAGGWGAQEEVTPRKRATASVGMGASGLVGWGGGKPPGPREEDDGGALSAGERKGGQGSHVPSGQ